MLGKKSKEIPKEATKGKDHLIASVTVTKTYQVTKTLSVRKFNDGLITVHDTGTVFTSSTISLTREEAILLSETLLQAV